MNTHRNIALLLVILVMSLIPLASTQAQGPPSDRWCEQVFNRLLNANPDSPSAGSYKKQLASKGCDFSNLEVEIIEVVGSESHVDWDARVTNSGALTITNIKVEQTIDGVSVATYGVSTLAPGASLPIGGGRSPFAPGPHTLEVVITQAVRDDYGADDVATADFTVPG